VPMPPHYRIPDFSKFSDQDSTSTIEHISQYLPQAGEAATNEALKVRLFPLSLSISAFSWFASCQPILSAAGPIWRNNFTDTSLLGLRN
jgi:hypothetical protein